MKSRVLSHVRSMACGCAFFMAAGAVHAQSGYPARPLRMILPIPPGSVTDVIMRRTAQELSAQVGQPVIVENHPGGSMVIASEVCAKSAGDGYTLCIVSPDAMSFNPHVFQKLSYDPDRDFKPVNNLFFLVEGVVATGSLPANSIRELQAMAIAKPGSVNFGTLGAGTGPDIFRQWLARRWQAEIVGIPYKGGNLVIQALFAGEIHVSYVGIGNLAGQLSSNKLKVLAVAGSRRSPVLPSVPTMDEAGIGGYPIRIWWGAVVPAGTPDPVVSRLNSEFSRLFGDAKFGEFLVSQFVTPAVDTPAEFAAFLKRDRALAGQVVKEYNVPKQ